MNSVKSKSILKTVIGDKDDDVIETPFKVDESQPTTKQQNTYLSKRISLTKISAHLGFDQPEYLAILINLLEFRHKSGQERVDAMTELKIHLSEICELAGV